MKRVFGVILLFLQPVVVLAASVSGTLVGGGGIDDMGLVVVDDKGQRVDAYCLSACGDWFTEADKDDVVHLKSSYQGRKVLLQYTSEPNHDRIAGPGSEDLINFITAVRFLK